MAKSCLVVKSLFLHRLYNVKDRSVEELDFNHSSSILGKIVRYFVHVFVSFLSLDSEH